MPSAKVLEQKKTVVAELTEAIEEAEAYVNGTISYSDQHHDVEDKLINAMVKAGAWTVKEEEKTVPVFSAISLLLYNNFGTDGYSEIVADFYIGFVTEILIKNSDMLH